MPLSAAELSRLNSLSFSRLNDCANALGFPSLSSFFSAFSPHGFHGSASSFTPYSLVIDRRRILELIRRLNGNVSRYRLIRRYSLQSSNFYSSSISSSSPKPSSLFCLLPSDVSPSLFLSLLEEEAEKVPSSLSPFSGTDGIPSQAVLITLLMRYLKGGSLELLSDVLTNSHCNMYLDTFSSLASFWGMTAKSFALASEKVELILSPTYGMKDGDNSKKAILSRILSLSSSSSWAELVRKFPEPRQGAVKGIRTGMDRRMQVATILDLLKPFSLRLSDVLEEVPV